MVLSVQFATVGVGAPRCVRGDVDGAARGVARLDRLDRTVDPVVPERHLFGVLAREAHLNAHQRERRHSRAAARALADRADEVRRVARHVSGAGAEGGEARAGGAEEAGAPLVTGPQIATREINGERARTQVSGREAVWRYLVNASAPGRVALAALTTPWDQADIEAVQNSLQGLRTSSLQLKQQAYHALRDLTNAAYFSDPSAWRHMGYPGPDDI